MVIQERVTDGLSLVLIPRRKKGLGFIHDNRSIHGDSGDFSGGGGGVVVLVIKPSAWPNV